MYPFLFFLALTMFIKVLPHLLSSVLALEFLTLLIYFSLSTSLPLFSLDHFLTLLFLSVAVMEGVLGLSLVVLLTYKKGNDLLTSKIFLW